MGRKNEIDELTEAMAGELQAFSEAVKKENTIPRGQQTSTPREDRRFWDRLTPEEKLAKIDREGLDSVWKAQRG